MSGSPLSTVFTLQGSFGHHSETSVIVIKPHKQLVTVCWLDTGGAAKHWRLKPSPQTTLNDLIQLLNSSKCEKLYF